jgi:glyoxylase-like metal-dependent hydrolase (beta-lactamase superfamily II)
VGKVPQSILDSIWAFPPNRETLGGTAYLIVGNDGNTLVDCPAWDDRTQGVLADQGGVARLILTHRDGMSLLVAQMQDCLGCEVIIQEQEAYLLPGVTVTAFRQEMGFPPYCRVIWTPGYSPGSACLYYSLSGGVLFSGRHLLPNPQGDLGPLRTAKTFHWLRQLRSVEQLRSQFSATTLSYLCPGANLGYLRGQRVITQAYEVLQQLDLVQLGLSRTLC